MLQKERLLQIQVRLKQQLKVESFELKNKKQVQERRRADGLSQVAPKTVHRELKGQKNKATNSTPQKNNLKNFGKHYRVNQLYIAMMQLG